MKFPLFVAAVNFWIGLTFGRLVFARGWTHGVRSAIRVWRFKRRFPIGCVVRINGKCCDQQHAGRLVLVKRYQLDMFPPEVRFDLDGVNEPHGCCERGMDRVGEIAP